MVAAAALRDGTGLAPFSLQLFRPLPGQQLVAESLELVVEVAFDGVQDSPVYPAGLALCFARVRRYRGDKTPAEASTVAAVRAIRARGGGAG